MKNLYFFFQFLVFYFLFLSLFIGIPIIHEFYLTGLVNRLPSAVLSGLLMVISFFMLFWWFNFRCNKKNKIRK